MAAPNVIEALIAELGSLRSKHKRLGQAGHAVLFDMLAEAGRNPALARILRDHSTTMRRLLAAVIQQGQARGTIDPGLDAESAAAVLMSVIDGARTLALRNPKMDMDVAIGLLETLITRFLTPPQGAAGRA